MIENAPAGTVRAGELAELINRHIEFIPPQFTLDGRQAKDLTVGRGVSTIAALEKGGLVGALSWLRPDRDDPGLNEDARDRAVLCWIVAEYPRRDVVEELLKSLHAGAAQAGCHGVATSRCDLGVTWFGIPAAWNHIVGGMQEQGYRRDETWVIMTGPTNLEKGPAGPEISGLRLEWEIEEEKREWNLKAAVGSESAGECTVWGVPSRFSECPGYREWTTLEFIGVEEGYARKGVASRLLAAQMEKQRSLGVRRVILQTETDNEPARRFFESFGFIYGPECWSFSRKL